MKLYQKIAQTLGALNTSISRANNVWIDKHVEVMERIEKDSLPHGSGFDAGCKIDLENSTEDRIIIQADFHAMDGHGYYCGWKEYSVIIKPSLAFGFSVDIKGRNFNGLKEYISDTFYHILNQEV